MIEMFGFCLSLISWLFRALQRYTAVYGPICYVRLGFPAMSIMPFQAEKVSCSFPTRLEWKTYNFEVAVSKAQRVGHLHVSSHLFCLKHPTNETWKDNNKDLLPKVQVVRFHIHNPRLGHLAMWMSDPIAGRLLDVHLSLDRRSVGGGCIAVPGDVEAGWYSIRICYSVFRCITNQNIPCLAVRLMGTSMTLQYHRPSQNIYLRIYIYIKMCVYIRRINRHGVRRIRL